MKKDKEKEQKEEKTLQESVSITLPNVSINISSTSVDAVKLFELAAIFTDPYHYGLDKKGSHGAKYT